MFRKVLSIVLAITMSASLFACGGGAGGSSASSGSEKIDLNTLKNEIENIPLAASLPRGINIESMDSINFGSYPQENDPNYKTPIEWLVLERYSSEGKALLISKYILDVQKYHNSETNVIWENCDLRKWMNNDFYNVAFSKSEQKQIVESTVDNFTMSKQHYNTNDKLFCICNTTPEEINKYFGNKMNSITKPTIYANSKNKVTKYWSRYASNDFKGDYYYEYIECQGYENNVGSHTYSFPNASDVGVRPMMWISYDKQADNKSASEQLEKNNENSSLKITLDNIGDYLQIETKVLTTKWPSDGVVKLSERIVPKCNVVIEPFTLSMTSCDSDLFWFKNNKNSIDTKIDKNGFSKSHDSYMTFYDESTFDSFIDRYNENGKTHHYELTSGDYELAIK